MIGPILSIINKFIPDKDAAAKAAVALETEMTKQMSLKASVVNAEISNGSGKWRPRAMNIFLAMLCIHYALYDIAPWIITVFEINVWIPQDPGFTDGLLSVIKLGLGGYIGGRSVEKGISIWKK